MININLENLVCKCHKIVLSVLIKSNKEDFDYCLSRNNIGVQ